MNNTKGIKMIKKTDPFTRTPGLARKTGLCIRCRQKVMLYQILQFSEKNVYLKKYIHMLSPIKKIKKGVQMLNRPSFIFCIYYFCTIAKPFLNEDA